MKFAVKVNVEVAVKVAAHRAFNECFRVSDFKVYELDHEHELFFRPGTLGWSLTRPQPARQHSGTRILQGGPASHGSATKDPFSLPGMGFPGLGGGPLATGHTPHEEGSRTPEGFMRPPPPPKTPRGFALHARIPQISPSPFYISVSSSIILGVSALFLVLQEQDLQI